jgi:hypothetical protein
MQLLFVLLTVSALAMLKRGHALPAAAASVLALAVMLEAFSAVPCTLNP